MLIKYTILIQTRTIRSVDMLNYHGIMPCDQLGWYTRDGIRTKQEVIYRLSNVSHHRGYKRILERKENLFYYSRHKLAQCTISCRWGQRNSPPIKRLTP